MHSYDYDPRKMFGDFVRQRTISAKDLARRIGCDPRSAENYRAGRYWPPAKHWPAIIAAFGRDATEAVFHPDAASERLATEVLRLETQLAAARAEHRMVSTPRRRPGTRRPQAAAGRPPAPLTRQ